MTNGPDYDFLEQEAPEEAVVDETPAAEPVAETVEPPATPATVVPTTTEPAEERVPVAAVMAERRKRQELERRLAELEQNRQQPQPSFTEAPEAYVQQIEARANQRLHAALEAQARETYADYDEVFLELEQYAEENPACVPQILNSPNPALAAYKFGKQLRELKAMQDPDAYRQKIESEVRARIEAEYAAKEAAKLKATNDIPPDLTAVRASKDEEVLPDDSLDSILSSRKK